MSRRNVYFAKVSRNQIGAFDLPFADDLLRALDPHRDVTRYERRWKLSRPRVEAGFIVGKLGFVRTSQTAQTDYDEEREDFVTAETVSNQGSFSMFVIDLEKEILAFEERPPAIERQSFLGALRGLLRKDDRRWSLTLLPDPTDFDDFVRSVDQVQRVRMVIHSPNPRYIPAARNFEEVIEESHAAKAEVVVVARKGQSLNVVSGPVRGGLDQIAQQGKGTLKATGIKGGARRVWVFGARLLVAVLEEEIETPEGIWSWMRRQIHERFDG